MTRILVEIWFPPLPWILSDISMSSKLVALGTSAYSFSLQAFAPDHLTHHRLVLVITDVFALAQQLRYSTTL